MTVAALLHPDVSANAVQPFREACSDIYILADLEKAEDNLKRQEPFSAALIFGGDGTIHRHLPQLHQRKIPALIVPAGSGNDFAKSLGIANQRTALAAWKQFCSQGDNVREIDLGVIHKGTKEVLFCCVAGIGLDADANRIANAMPQWLKGSAGYVLAALRAIARFQPTDFIVQADSLQPTARQLSKPGMFIAVGNAGRYGGGAKVAPQAQLDDGLLDICFVGKMGRIKLTLCFPTVFFGGHLRLNEVEYFQAQTVRIETGRPLEIYADGEPVCQTPVEISLLPRALKVIVPALDAASKL
jgi:diacylglycerol kinase (ATP)